MLVVFISLLVFAYFLGSTPTGYLISRAKGINIKKIGSGNIGGTNVSRALGPAWGFFVGICDLLKGLIPTLLAVNFLSSQWQIAAVALCAVLGHIFPVWLSFKGGKGVATTFGVVAALFSWKIFLIWILVWVLLLVIFKIVSFTNLLLVSFLPLIFLTVFDSMPYFVFCLALTCLIWWAHRENLKRIARGEESKMSFQY